MFHEIVIKEVQSSGTLMQKKEKKNRHKQSSIRLSTAGCMSVIIFNIFGKDTCLLECVFHFFFFDGRVNYCQNKAH